MLAVTKPAPNRVEIEVRGTIDTDQMAVGLDELIAASEDVIGGRMLYRLTDFSMPTIGAIGVELRRLPKLFALLAKFDRCAVLSDTAWVRKAAEIEGALFPGIEIKSFEPSQEAAAEAWLAGG